MANVDIKGNVLMNFAELTNCSISIWPLLLTSIVFLFFFPINNIYLIVEMLIVHSFGVVLYFARAE